MPGLKKQEMNKNEQKNKQKTKPNKHASWGLNSGSPTCVAFYLIASASVSHLQ